jgi:hypothetical protein
MIGNQPPTLTLVITSTIAASHVQLPGTWNFGTGRQLDAQIEPHHQQSPIGIPTTPPISH